MSFGDLGQSSRPGAKRQQGRSGFDGDSIPSSMDSSLAQQIVQTVMGNIATINTNINAIMKLIQNMGTPKDTDEARARLNTTIDQTKVLIRDSNTVIRGYKPDTAESRQQHQKLIQDLQEVANRFRDIANMAKTKEKTTVARAKEKMAEDHRQGSRNTAPFGHDDREPQETDNLLGRGPTRDKEKEKEREREEIQAMEQDIQFNQRQIAEREEAIVDIERTIREVNEMFKDLSELVVEQGYQIDTIEDHITSSATKVHGAKEELDKANTYQKSSRWKMCCIGLIVVVVLAVVIFVSLAG